MPTAIQKSGGIRANNTTVRTENGETVCTLHSTNIARWNHKTDTVTLHTGGYNTPTTLRRMNECLVAWGFKVHVCKADFRSALTVTVTRQGVEPYKG